MATPHTSDDDQHMVRRHLNPHYSLKYIKNIGMVMLGIKDLEVFSSRKQIQKAEIRCSISGDEVLFLILYYFTSGLVFLVSKTLKNIFDHGVYNITILKLATYS